MSARVFLGRDLATLMQRQLEASTWSKRLLIAAFVVGYFGTLLPSAEAANTALILMTVAMFGWVAGVFVSARTGRLAQQVTQLTAARAPHAQVERAIGAALSRFTLYRTVRIVLYHQLAMLRHQQGRFDEASMICAMLLTQSDLGLAGRLRHALMLILAEARLLQHDAPGAYAPLVAMHRLGSALTLGERVQLLGLQIRYETMSGHDHAALAGLESKLPMLDMLGAAASGRCHRRLAEAAERTGRTRLAEWLHERAELFGDNATEDEPIQFDPSTPMFTE